MFSNIPKSGKYINFQRMSYAVDFGCWRQSNHHLLFVRFVLRECATKCHKRCQAKLNKMRKLMSSAISVAASRTCSHFRNINKNLKSGRKKYRRNSILIKMLNREILVVRVCASHAAAHRFRLSPLTPRTKFSHLICVQFQTPLLIQSISLNNK